MIDLPTPLPQNFSISGSALDTLMPMHLCFGSDVEITHVAPTLAKIIGSAPLGRNLFEVIEVTRPRMAQSLQSLLSLQGARLAVQLSVCPEFSFRGVLVPLPDRVGGVLNLSLGVSFARVVSQFGLTLRDFSPCDQVIDLLYLQEANQAITRESFDLTKRLQTAREMAEAQAMTDALTGLHNRRAMDQALQMLAEKTAPRFGLMHLDLDFFKDVNDTLGHAAGDHVLVHVADVLRSQVRSDDIVARVGGDEFILLLRNCDDPALLETIAERLIRKLEEPTVFGGQNCQVSASVGSVLSSHYERLDPDQILSDADIALYASKHRGRAQHTLFSEDLRAPVSSMPRAN